MEHGFDSRRRYQNEDSSICLSLFLLCNNIGIVQDGKFIHDGVILTIGRISQSLLLNPSARFFALLRMTRGVWETPILLPSLCFIPCLQVPLGHFDAVVMTADVGDAVALELVYALGVQHQLFELAVYVLLVGLHIDDGA